MARERIYSSNAERQAAYRTRSAERIRALADEGALERIRTLEAALARSERRADRAEVQAAAARRAVPTRPERQTGTPRPPLPDDDVTALRHRVQDLEMLVGRLQLDLAAAREELQVARRTDPNPPSRAERRAAAKRQRRVCK